MICDQCVCTLPNAFTAWSLWFAEKGSREMKEQRNGHVSSSLEQDAQGSSQACADRTLAQPAQHDTHAVRAVSTAGLQQLQHHLRKATEKSANRHVHQALLVLQHMLVDA
jgi:hypothetical protein